jgi:hypothetical protein
MATAANKLVRRAERDLIMRSLLNVKNRNVDGFIIQAV